MASDYDKTYREVNDYFGETPEKILISYRRIIDFSKKILDIGAGQGRNCLYLAKDGARVDALEPSSVALEIIRRKSENIQKTINTYSCSFEDFDGEKSSYGTIMAFGILQILSRDSIRLFVEKCQNWLSEKGLLFVTAFTVQDPGFEKRNSWKNIGKNSFQSKQGDILTYFEPEELKQIFCEFHDLYYWEGFGPEHKHGDSPPERHGMVEAVFQRK